jgi:hypothetical protein
MLSQSYPSYKTVHRRFQAWCRDEILRRLLRDIANELRDRGALGQGWRGRDWGNETRKRHENHGDCLSPWIIAIGTHAANHHEVRLVQLCFDFYMIKAKPENLNGDRAYDSDPLDEVLRRDGIEMIAPHRANRSKPPTQDRRRLTRYPLAR